MYCLLTCGSNTLIKFTQDTSVIMNIRGVICPLIKNQRKNQRSTGKDVQEQSFKYTPLFSLMVCCYGKI